RTFQQRSAQFRRGCGIAGSGAAHPGHLLRSAELRGLRRQAAGCSRAGCPRQLCGADVPVRPYLHRPRAGRRRRDFFEAGLQMRTRTAVAAIVLLSVGVVGLQALEDRAHAALTPEADAADVLYVQSPAVLKRAALSYDALVADLYWIRAVQYYGGKRLSKGPKSYDLLYPLLR